MVPALAALSSTPEPFHSANSHHLGYEGEVCGSTVRQKGTVVVSRPWVPVHPQHGADSRGSGGRADAAASSAAFGASVPHRGGPISTVHLMRGTEELGVPQLRERHVHRETRAVKISPPKVSHAQQQEDAGKKVGIPRKKKKKKDEGGV